MNRNKVISLADAPECPAVVTVFYDKYRGKIAEVETIGQRNHILFEMQQDFETKVRQKPQNQNQLLEIYELLKRKCWEVELSGN